MPIVKYECEWCGNEFEQYVRYSQGDTSQLDGRKGKKSSLSTQVRCPKCLRMIPTWNKIDGVKRRYT